MQTQEIVLMGHGGMGDTSPASGALALLLGMVAVGGVLAYVGAKNSHRSPARSHSSARPWAKKGVFRGLGNAVVQLMGGKPRRRRRGR